MKCYELPEVEIQAGIAHAKTCHIPEDTNPVFGNLKEIRLPYNRHAVVYKTGNFLCPGFYSECTV